MMKEDVAEMRFNVDPDFLRELQRKLGLSKTTDVARTALTVLNWAADEVSQGRVILSTKADGTDVHRLVVPGLTNAGVRNPERMSR
jgi:hypothetical protein